MSIKVRYFASLKEAVGHSEQELQVSEPLTVSTVWQRLNPDLAMPSALLAAVNMEYVGLDAPVQDGDELAFFRRSPEVNVHIELQAQAFEPWTALQTYQNQHTELSGKYGATSVFVGTMRDFNQGDSVQAMFLEHYPGMTEKKLQEIAKQAQEQWQILDSLLIHRIGMVYPDETLVLVAVWSAHRGDAFDASRYIMENLKSQAPFWKRESLASGAQRWVEKNSDGYQTDTD